MGQAQQSDSQWGRDGENPIHVSSNPNQLTKRVHATGRFSDADWQDLRQSYDKLWEATRSLLSSLAKLQEKASIGSIVTHCR